MSAKLRQPGCRVALITSRGNFTSFYMPREVIKLIKAIAPPIQLLVISGAIALMDELCGLNKIKLYK